MLRETSRRILNLNHNTGLGRSKALIAKKAKVVTVLKKHNVKQIDKVMIDLIPFIVPVGAKSNARGHAFNKIVCEELRRICSKKKYLTFVAEYNHKLFHERLDWMIINTKTNQNICGYNQIDLWSGGHQLNRGSKYVLDDHLHKRLKLKKLSLVNIVLDGPVSLRKNTKVFKIVSHGVKNNRLFTLSMFKKFLNKV